MFRRYVSVGGREPNGASRGLGVSDAINLIALKCFLATNIRACLDLTCHLNALDRCWDVSYDSQFQPVASAVRLTTA